MIMGKKVLSMKMVLVQLVREQATAIKRIHLSGIRR